MGQPGGDVLIVVSTSTIKIYLLFIPILIITRPSVFTRNIIQILYQIWSNPVNYMLVVKNIKYTPAVLNFKIQNLKNI